MKTIRVKMLEREGSLEAGLTYNLRVDFATKLLKNKRAIALEPGDEGPDLSAKGLPRLIKMGTSQSSGKRVKVKMLKRHCSHDPGAILNLPQGPELAFLLDKGLAIVLVPDPSNPAEKRRKKVVRPAELKS